jgi:hypothetical protein
VRPLFSSACSIALWPVSIELTMSTRLSTKPPHPTQSQKAVEARGRGARLCKNVRERTSAPPEIITRRRSKLSSALPYSSVTAARSSGVNPAGPGVGTIAAGCASVAPPAGGLSTTALAASTGATAPRRPRWGFEAGVGRRGPRTLNRSRCRCGRSGSLWRWRWWNSRRLLRLSGARWLAHRRWLEATRNLALSWTLNSADFHHSRRAPFGRRHLSPAFAGSAPWRWSRRRFEASLGRRRWGGLRWSLRRCWRRLEAVLPVTWNPPHWPIWFAHRHWCMETETGTVVNSRSFSATTAPVRGDACRSLRFTVLQMRQW